MKILAFDTSCNISSVSVLDGYDVLSYVQDLTLSSQAEKLIPLIEKALRIAELSYLDIECLAVTNGPGSFTGIRVGLACAKALLLNNNITATSVSNFEVLYYRATTQVQSWDKIIVLLNAYRGQIYAQIFDNKRQSPGEHLLMNHQEIITLIRAINPSQTIVCCGDAVSLIYEEIKGASNIMILPRLVRIQALYIGRYVYSTINTRKLMPIKPLYIRAPDVNIAKVNKIL